MSTNRESEADFMDARYFADLVYDKWIFDVPKIFDICTLYGSYNAKVPFSFFLSLFSFSFSNFRFRSALQEVNRLVSSLLNLQPKYKDDLKQAVPIISRVVQARTSSITLPLKASPSPSSSGHLQSISSVLPLTFHAFFPPPTRKWRGGCSS
jgi:hypothetical protein